MNKPTSEVTSNYELIARAFTVVSIAQPIKIRFSPEDSIITAWEEFMTYNVTEDWCAIVSDEEHIYGYVTFDDPLWDSPLPEGNIRGETHPIKPEMLVPSTLSLLELVPLFEQSTFYFVLTKNNITHVVSFYDLDKLPVKLSLFSLLLELESKIIDLLSLDQTKIESFLNSLSASRLSKARNLCKLKYDDETPRNLLLCTTFIDKKEMLLKSSNFKEKLPFESRKKLNSFFKKVEDVRNQIAHSDSIIEILPLPRKWNIFIQDLSSLIKAIARIRN